MSYKPRLRKVLDKIDEDLLHQIGKVVCSPERDEIKDKIRELLLKEDFDSLRALLAKHLKKGENSTC